MERNYTEAVQEGFFDLIEKDTAAIWANLDRSAAMIKSGNWKDHYSEVVEKYRFSGRFAVMRILFEEATRLPPSKINEAALARGFHVDGIGDFPDISIRHAKNLTDDEVALYHKLLLRRAQENDPDCITEAEGLISRILQLPSAGEKCNLTREEIIRLGHMVDFTLDDMQFLLLRSLGDNEAGFRYSASMDIIDIYGFITHAALPQVDELKAWYLENAAHIKKAQYEDKPVQFTQDVADSIDRVFAAWPPEERNDKFKVWLKQKAPHLDQKAKTARKIYVNLAAYAYNLTQGFRDDVGDVKGENFFEDVNKISQKTDYLERAQEYFFNGKKPDKEKCEAKAKKLIYENAECAGDFRNHTKDTGRYYHVLHVNKGKVDARGTLNRSSKQRIQDILMDNETPLKSDLLYLLWFAANRHWLVMNSSADSKVIFMDDFLAAARCLLEAALLPEFYPPNVLEEALMIALALGDENKVPAVIYESICSAFTNEGKGKKKPGAKKKKPEDREKIAEDFFELLKSNSGKEKGACRKQIAAKWGIGIGSVENYCDQYVAQYYVDHLADLPSEEDCVKDCVKRFYKTEEAVRKCVKTFPDGLA